MTTPANDAFQAAVRARAQLLADAGRVLTDTRLDAMPDREIYEAVLKKFYGEKFDATGRSDAYLAGAFSHAIQSAAASGGASAPSGDGGTSAPAKRAGIPRADSRHLPGWMKPLSVSRRPAERSDTDSKLPPWRRPLRFSKRGPGIPDDAA